MQKSLLPLNMQNNQTKNPTNILFLTLSVLLVVYIIARAILIDMTHDEAYSFYNVKHFWYVETLCTGNTHWFNFVAIKVAVLLGLEKASQLRWLSIISSIAFIIVAYVWIRSVKDITSKCFSFLLLFNPYLLDYFSLARGYSTGLAFEALGILFLVLSFTHDRKKYSMSALLFAGLAAIANFNFFYFFSAFCLFYFYVFYFKNGSVFLKDKRFYIDTIYALGITSLVLRALVFITECSNDIGAYGGTSFIESLFGGYLNGYFYEKFVFNYTLATVLQYALFALIVIAIINGLKNFKKYQNWLYFIVSVITGIMLLLCLLTKWAFHVLYPIDRTTLMFFPLFTVLIVCFLVEVFKKLMIKKVVLFLLSLILAVNFAVSVNFLSPMDYPEQVDAREAFQYLDKIGAKKVGIAPELYGVFRNYYQQTEHEKFSFYGESINTSIPFGIDENIDKLAEFEYLVLYPPYKLSFYKNNNVGLETVKLYPSTYTLIVKVLRH